MMGVPRTVRVALFLLGSVAASPAFPEFEDAFSSPEEAAQVNERTVGVVFARDELFVDLLEDVESSLHLAAGLRIVPIVGRNDVQNVYDLLYLDGVDLALVRADAIEYVRRVAGLAGMPRLVRSVARIGDEKIVVVAGAAYTSLEQLAGRPVAFGRPGSGEFVTGTLVFDSLGVAVEKVEADGVEALEKVRSGELAAMVHLLDSPGSLPAVATGSTGSVNVLALPGDEPLSTLYRDATLDASDLPGLIPVGHPVSTFSVDVNLVAYSWNARNDRTRRMERFVEALVDRLEELQGNDFQPEWKEVRLDADSPSLGRSPMVKRALVAREAALERWQETRRLAESEEARTTYVELSVDGRARTVGRADDAGDREPASDVERPFDELDALLSAPTGRPPPSR